MKISIVFTTFCPNTFGNDFIVSTKKHNPEIEVIMVDQTVEKYQSKGKALNVGRKQAQCNTLLFCDDDFICTGKIEPTDALLFGLDIRLGFSSHLFKGGAIDHPRPGEYCVGIDANLFDELGGFDENFLCCGYEVIDLCHRAWLKGIEIIEHKMPLRHLSAGTKHLAVPVHHTTLRNNRAYILSKEYK